MEDGAPRPSEEGPRGLCEIPLEKLRGMHRHATESRMRPGMSVRWRPQLQAQEEQLPQVLLRCPHRRRMSSHPGERRRFRHVHRQSRRHVGYEFLCPMWMRPVQGMMLMLVCQAPAPTPLGDGAGLGIRATSREVALSMLRDGSQQTRVLRQEEARVKTGGRLISDAPWHRSGVRMQE